jgi:hypothetical protein
LSIGELVDMLAAILDAAAFQTLCMIRTDMNNARMISPRATRGGTSASRMALACRRRARPAAGAKD